MPSSGNTFGGIEQPIRIERALHPHLLGDVGGGELDAHQLAFLDADAVLAGEAPAELDAELEDLGAAHLGALELRPVIGIVEDQGMQIAVAGMENVGDVEAIALA